MRTDLVPLVSRLGSLAAVLTAGLATGLFAQSTLPVTSDLGFVGNAGSPSISGDGGVVAFTAPGAIPGDTCHDLYVRDLASGALSVLAACDNSLGGVAWPSSNPQLSANGAYVVYERLAAPGSGVQVHRAEIATGTTVVVSVDDTGFLADAGGIYPAPSGDGTHVAFMSLATNLVSPALPFNNVWQIYLRDVAAASTVLLSAALGGGPSFDGHSQYPSISADGRFVAFESVAEDLVAPGLDANSQQDVYVTDRDPDGNGDFHDVAPLTVLLSASPAGIAPPGVSSKPALSGDGRFVAFLSNTVGLLGVPGNAHQVYVADRDPDGNGNFYDTALALEHVSVSSLGLSPSSSCYHPAISADGRYVAYATFSGLTPNDPSNKDAFVHDRETGQTIRVSVDSAGHGGDGHSGGGWYSDDPAISADGSRVAFSSQAANLVPADTNGLDDVFVHELCPPVGIDLGYALAGTGGLLPHFTVCGDAATGGTLRFRLRDAAPLSPAFLPIGLVSNPAPILGGTLVPVPWLVVYPYTTGPAGEVDVLAPGGNGPLDLYAQFGVFDPGAPLSFSLSNALRIPFLP